MLLRRVFVLLPTLLLISAAMPGAGTGSGVVRVRLVTSAGNVTLALDPRRAPRTVANFMRYVDDGRFEGTSFYRSARRKSDARFGFVQGGIGTDARRILPSVPLERTDRTGIRHLNGTISMAHGADPNSGNGNFSIMVGDNPGLDASRTSAGFAAFGKVVGGMDVVHKMLAMRTGGGRGVMRGQMILNPVIIRRAQRLDGTARPTGRPKPWLVKLPWQQG